MSPSPWFPAPALQVGRHFPPRPPEINLSEGKGSAPPSPPPPVHGFSTGLAVDLHAHSCHAAGTSPALILENIVPCAQRKGIDVLGTGDCLQPEWLREIEAKLMENGSGFLLLRQEFESFCRPAIPFRLGRPLRFVLSTEVCCAPRGTPHLGGLHHLIFFRSFATVRRFRSRVVPFGNLLDGRPTLKLTSRQLLELVLELGDECALAPAHIMNPWFSVLGSISGERSPLDVFGDLASSLLAVEMGLTSTPTMCRQLSALDPHPLFCSSDAHSIDKIGREYTLLDIEPNYDALVGAFRSPGDRRIRGYVKFPVAHTRYFQNCCGHCHASFDCAVCPRCSRLLAIGSRDRSAMLADRKFPRDGPTEPRCQELFPLVIVIASIMNRPVTHNDVRTVYTRLIEALGSERHILVDATEDELRGLTTGDLASAIVHQRQSPLQLGYGTQLSLDLPAAQPCKNAPEVAENLGPIQPPIH